MQASSAEGHFETEDRVSIWIGTFSREAAFEEYLHENWEDPDRPNCQFWDDLGIEWHDHDFQEAHFHGEVTSVAELISGLSWIASYKDELMSRCRSLNVARGNAVIAYYEYAYPLDADFTSSYVAYVGAFRYTTGDHPFRR